MSTKIGTRIFLLRRSLNMTQEELGNKIGVTKATINKYETGVTPNLKRPRIEALAKALEVSPEFLMGWSDDPGRPIKFDEAGQWLMDYGTKSRIVEVNLDEPNPYHRFVTEKQLKEEEKELINIYRKLDLRHRIKLLNFAMDLESEIEK